MTLLKEKKGRKENATLLQSFSMILQMSFCCEIFNDKRENNFYIVIFC